MNKNCINDALAPGYHFHWYEILSVLGRGGYGITYLAMDTNLGRKVAIKEYLPLDFASRVSDDTVQPMSDEQGEIYQWGLKRFIKEARTLSMFKHPNILQVLSVFEFNKTAYMVMEYQQGQNLSHIYKQTQEPLSEKALLDIFVPILEGLALVHKEDFIHRDIKPVNILIREDQSPVLLDFGSARQTLGGKTKPLTSLVTAGYAPFEQYHETAGKQGPWTDIYGIAACLYTAIHHKCPANALDRASSIINKSKDCYEPISELAVNDYSGNFLLAIDYGLRFQPEDRPQDAQEWADILLGKKDAPEFDSSVKISNEILNDEEKTVLAPPARTPVTAPAMAAKKATPVLPVDEDKTVVMPVRKTAPPTPVKPNIVNPPPSAPLSQTPFPQPQPQQQPPTPAQENVYWQESLQDNRLEKVKNSMWILGPVALVATSIAFAAILFYIRVELPDKSPGLDNEKITRLLIKAEQLMLENKLLEPEGDAAVYHYLEVLQLDPGNQKAQSGLNKIQQRLHKAINQNIEENQLGKAEENLLALEAIAPTSADTFMLRQRLNSAHQPGEPLQIEEQTPDLNIELARLLKQGDNALRAGRLTKPASSSALSYYRQALNIDAQNPRALEGIQAVYNRLESIFNRQLENYRFDRAEKILHTIKSVAPGTKMAKRADQKYSSQVQSSKLEQEILNDMISQFKNTLESQDLEKIRSLSEYQEGRHQFVQLFFDNYRSFRVHVSGVQYSAKHHKTIAKVNLSHLINKNGYSVQPGPWSDFEIEISKNELAEWKVHW